MIKCITLAVVLAVLVCQSNAECGLDSLSCLQAISSVISKDAQDVEAVCSAYNKFTGCLKDKGCTDIDSQTKDLTFDLSKCSAGMVQISIVCIVAALIASLFTR